MASTLPLSTYHRASQVGAGTYGSVLTVYNADGDEYAMKLFLKDDEDETKHADDDEADEEEGPTVTPIELGALREISCLRLLKAYPHENIVPLYDIQSEWADDEEDAADGGGAGTAGCLGMVIPLYRTGTLAAAIHNQRLVGYPRHVKVRVAHGLLSAVAFLHDNGILHRDIKPDNVMLEDVGIGQGGNWFRPVLIDFSLAKPVDWTIYYGMLQPNSNQKAGKEPRLGVSEALEPTQHTGEVGTVTYTAPEVVARRPYGKPMDLWSVGVVLLELLLDRTLTSQRNKDAQREIQTALDQLPHGDQPFPDLVRRLLQVEPTGRLTARQALAHPLFAKFQLPVPEPIMMRVADALPLTADDIESVNNENATPTKATPASSKSIESTIGTSRHGISKIVTHKLSPTERKRYQRIDRLCQELQSRLDITRQAAFEYSQQLDQLEDDLDDLNSSSQGLLDCVVLAHRFFELEVLDLIALDRTRTGPFAKWSLADYIDSEATLFLILDYCLYPRRLVEYRR